MMKIVYKCPLSCAAASSAAASFAFLVFSTVSAIACKLFCAILTFEFALVGTILGAYCGALVGLKSKSSFLHGAKVGAITGCVLSIEFLRKAFSLWDSDDCAIGIFVHLVQILNERIERLSAHSTVCSNGKSMLKITNKRHTGKNTADTLCNGTTCSICLQEFQQGEMVCSLPPCRHIFHSSCINEWFIGHNTCPLCRKTPFMLENVD